MPNFEKELLLITCASGKQARELIPHAAKKWKNIRLQVNSVGSKGDLHEQYPDLEIIPADFEETFDCRNLLKDVTTLLLVDPPFHRHETQLAMNMIDAAVAQRDAGGPFKHIVYSSVIHPSLRKLLNHDCKRYVEEYLIESGLQYTIVQPTHLMETLPLASLMKQDDPTFTANWNPDVKFSFVSTKDVGEAVFNILVGREKHFYATYQLVGTPTALSYNETMALVSEAIGKEVQIEKRAIEEAAEEGVKAILGVSEIDLATKETGARMFFYYNDRGLVGNNGILAWLLGRHPLDYKTWVQQKAAEIKAQLAEEQTHEQEQ